MNFQTDFCYNDRASKAKFVWLKYHSILQGQKILDIGADECQLKKFIDDRTSYWGIGLGGNPDQELDIQHGKLPFEDNSFGCVLCLDVLEHVENIHEIFDEICRITYRYVIISLPNAYSAFWYMLRSGDYSSDASLKFYGLPLEKPIDRHKWFFSSEEAEEFVIYRAEKNNMKILQIDYSGSGNEGNGWRRLLRTFAITILLRKDFNTKNLYAGTLWAVLEK